MEVVVGNEDPVIKTTSEMHVATQISKTASGWCCWLELFNGANKRKQRGHRSHLEHLQGPRSFWMNLQQKQPPTTLIVTQHLDLLQCHEEEKPAHHPDNILNWVDLIKSPGNMSAAEFMTICKEDLIPFPIAPFKPQKQTFTDSWLKIHWHQLA